MKDIYDTQTYIYTLVFTSVAVRSTLYQYILVENSVMFTLCQVFSISTWNYFRS